METCLLCEGEAGRRIACAMREAGGKGGSAGVTEQGCGCLLWERSLKGC